jgi:Tol biopolymer transport system component
MKIHIEINAIMLILTSCTIGKYIINTSIPVNPSPGESTEIQQTKTNTIINNITSTAIIPNESGMIAFVYTPIPFQEWEHIYTMDLMNKNIVQLTFADYGQYSPSWSPDGKSIAFASADGITTTLYRMNADGSDISLLIRDPVIDSSPNWSPDGSQIVFVSGRDEAAPWTCKIDCGSEIYMMKYDGTEIRRITNSPGFDESPKWSPDGKRILFSSNREGNYNIYTMNTDGTEIKQLTDYLGFDGSPDWSPDGQQIVFVSDREGRNKLFTMDIREKTINNLTNTVGDERDPDWSSDGRKIIYTSSKDDPNPDSCQYKCNYEIYILYLDTMKEIRITNTPGKESDPVWKP